MPKKILVIDDEPSIVKMLQSRFQANGYEVAAAFNGKQGLDAVEQERPDIIVLDVLMPEMDGFTFIRKLKSDPKNKNIPTIVLTAKEKMRDLFELEGADEYVLKPFDSQELLKKVDTLLKKAEEKPE